MNSVFPRNEYIEIAKKEGHSEEFIDESLEYVNNLVVNNLPVIFSTKHLAELLKISYKDLMNIIYNREDEYSNFKIRKKRTGYREIMSPSENLKYIQRWINNSILKKVKLEKCCKGFIQGSSIKNNAEIHENKDAILKFDLLRFFDTINEKRVYGVFRNLGYAKNLAVDLAKITTVESSFLYWESALKNVNELKGFAGNLNTILPQGAPTSPYLSNIIATQMDKRLSALSSKLGVVYSRYADDIVFSGELDKLPSANTVEKIIRQEGFLVNRSKTKIQKRGNRQIVTGLTVTNGVHVPKKYKKDIWYHLHYCNLAGPKAHLIKNKIYKSNFKDWLFGRICFVYSIEPEVGKKMMDAFNEILWIL